MAKSYHLLKCPLCSARISGNGLAQSGHKRKHVKEGLYKEQDGKFYFTALGGIVFGAERAKHQYLLSKSDALKVNFDELGNRDQEWYDTETLIYGLARLTM